MTQFLSQGVDYLGFLSAKLQDLHGFHTLAKELIQNADDAPGATSVSFDVCDDALIVENDGVFRDCGHVEERRCSWKDDSSKGHRCDFHRFRAVASGDKRAEEDTTGAFGIGFIAVYYITDRPELISGGRHWIIRPEELEERRIEQTTIGSTVGTRFRLPWAIEPSSVIRKELRVKPVHPEEAANLLVEELRQALPNAMLFLRKLLRVELKRNGQLLKVIKRDFEEDQCIVQDGSETKLWYLFRGSFEAEAKALRAEPSSQIEPKRKAEVVVALPEKDADIEGVLCAFLPTQHRTGFPFHINADFFPSSDRKTIQFDKDYQGRWNEAAVRAAAVTLAAALPSLPGLLGHRELWRLLARMESVHREANAGRRDTVLKEFWEKAQSEIAGSRVVYTSTSQWQYPRSVLLLEKEEEQESLPVLESAGLEIVHPDLRSHFSLLRSVGVRLLGPIELASALKAAGLDRPIRVEDAPLWLQSAGNREILGREVEVLLARNMNAADKQAARQEIAKCSIALGDDGWLRSPQSLRQATPETVQIFSSLGLRYLFLASENPDAVRGLVPSFDIRAALGILEKSSTETFDAVWRKDPERIVALIGWFAEQHKALRDDAQLKDRLCRLPIWPSGQTLRPLRDLVVPGNFEDPLHLASVVDLDILKGLHDFLIELGATQLTLLTYASKQVPQALSSNLEISPEARRLLLVLLATHLGELRDDEETRRALARCPLVECSNGTFRAPGEVYFAGEELMTILGSETLAAIEPTEHREAIRLFLEWLGVAHKPRPADVLRRIKSVIKDLPVGEQRASI